MKQYPSIPGPEGGKPLPCWAFFKHDGSNMRFSWDHKKGWWQFGTRHKLITPDSESFGEAIPLFMNKYAVQLEEAILTYFGKKTQYFTAFCEWFGPNSFAGQHDPAHPWVNAPNSPMDLVLFDVQVHRKGLLPPNQFLDLLGHLHVPRLVYQGNFTPEFVQNVRDNKYGLVEGVVCKGCDGPAPHGLWYCKVKTSEYLEKLKRVCGSAYQDYWE